MDLAAPHLHGNLEPAPESFRAWKPPREPERLTTINGFGLRHASVKAPKVVATLAPPCGYPRHVTVFPAHPWSADPAAVQCRPVMNVAYLAEVVPLALADTDPQLGEYLRRSHLEGFDTRDRTPLGAVRLVPRNRAVAGTPSGDVIDAMLETLDAQGSLLALERPLPGTIAIPCNAAIDIKYTGGPDGGPRLKKRDTIDGMSPRHDFSGPGFHSHKEDRLYRTTTFYHVAAICAKHNVERFSTKDLARAFSALVLRPDNVPRNCIFWRWRGTWVWCYLLAAVFGRNTTPAMFHGHAVGILAVITQLINRAVSAAAGRDIEIPCDRNTDDFLWLFPKATSQFSPELEGAFTAFTTRANIAISHPKSLVNVNRVRHDGFLWVAGAFPSADPAVTSVGVGFDNPRRYKIQINIKRALRGLTPDKALSVLGLLRWTHPVLPHSRALLIAYNRGVCGTPDHQVYKPTGEAFADLQRLLNVFRRPILTPVHCLLTISPPRRTVWTDASGAPGAGYQPHFGGYDGNLRAPWFYTFPVPAELQIGDPSAMSESELTISTTLLELLAFWVMLQVGGRWYRRRHYFTIRWYTDCQAGADAWRRQQSSSPAVNRLLRDMGAYCSMHAIYVEAVFIPRAQNGPADLLTHDDIARFSQATGIPPSARIPAGSPRLL